MNNRILIELIKSRLNIIQVLKLMHMHYAVTFNEYSHHKVIILIFSVL